MAEAHLDCEAIDSKFRSWRCGRPNSSRALMDVIKPAIFDLLCWLFCSPQGTESPHICNFFLAGYMIHHSHLKLGTCPDMLAFGFKGKCDFCILLSLVWFREFLTFNLSRIKVEEYFLFFTFGKKSWPIRIQTRERAMRSHPSFLSSELNG